MESTQVFEAAHDGDIGRVKFFVEEKGVSVSITNETNKTIAHVAVCNNNLEILDYVLAKDSSLLTKADDNNSTILQLAVERGALDIVKYLVEKRGANVFDKYLSDDNIPETVVHRAIKYDHLNILRYFIEERKVDVNVPVADQVEPLLLFALRRQNTRIFIYLVEDAKAKLNVLDSGKKNILLSAVKKGNFEILKYLVEEKNADVNVADAYKNTPLHLAATIKDFSKSYKYCKYLIMHGADIDKKNKIGKTPMCSFNHTKTVPLTFFALALQGDLNFLKYLFDIKKINVDINNDRWLGETLIDWAFGSIFNGPKVQYLVNEKHANLSMSQIFKFFDEFYDINYSDIKLDATAFKQEDENENTLLHRAVSGSDPVKLCKYLMARGSDINKKNNEGETPLHLAVSRGKQALCEYLVQEGADMNPKNNRGETPIHRALSCNQQEIFKYFADHNASIEDIHGTPLIHIAAKQNQISVLDYLVVKKKVDLNIPRKIDNWTPLHCAAYEGHGESFKYLIEHGANIKAKDVYGKTPLEVANDKNFIKSVENILEKRSRRSADEFSPTYYPYPIPNGHDPLKITGNVNQIEDKGPADVFGDIYATQFHDFLTFFYLSVLKSSRIRVTTTEKKPFSSTRALLQYKMDLMIERAVKILPEFKK